MGYIDSKNTPKIDDWRISKIANNKQTMYQPQTPSICI